MRAAQRVQITDAATESAPGRTNEDVFRVGDGWALILDGAGRYPGISAGCVHPVTWIVAHLAEHIANDLDDDGQSLTAILRNAIRATRNDHGSACDLSDPLSPGSTVAVARDRGDSIEWLVLGDCAVVIERHDGGHIVVIDDRVDTLPAAPVVDSEVRTYDPVYVATVRNQPGGFWVAGAIAEAADHALVGSIPRGDVQRVLLCSDGVSRLTERYGWSWNDVFTLTGSSGVGNLIRAVRQAESEDPDPRRWRGKRHDDATAVLASVASR